MVRRSPFCSAFLPCVLSSPVSYRARTSCHGSTHETDQDNLASVECHHPALGPGPATADWAFDPCRRAAAGFLRSLRDSDRWAFDYSLTSSLSPRPLERGRHCTVVPFRLVVAAQVEDKEADPELFLVDMSMYRYFSEWNHE